LNDIFLFEYTLITSRIIDHSGKKQKLSEGRGLIFKGEHNCLHRHDIELLVRSSFVWRLGSHLVHGMHSALKLLPYSLVNHSLPIYCRFSLECLGNHIYADVAAVPGGIDDRDRVGFQLLLDLGL